MQHVWQDITLQPKLDQHLPHVLYVRQVVVHAHQDHQQLVQHAQVDTSWTQLPILAAYAKLQLLSAQYVQQQQHVQLAIVDSTYWVDYVTHAKLDVVHVWVQVKLVQHAMQDISYSMEDAFLIHKLIATHLAVQPVSHVYMDSNNWMDSAHIVYHQM